jgi:hypothetical protein
MLQIKQARNQSGRQSRPTDGCLKMRRETALNLFPVNHLSQFHQRVLGIKNLAKQLQAFPSPRFKELVRLKSQVSEIVYDRKKFPRTPYLQCQEHRSKL